MREIIYKDIPCWYELSWQAKKPAIILRIHKEFLESMKAIGCGSPIIESYKSKFGFNKFNNFTEKYSGFDNSFYKRNVNGEFQELEIGMPVFKNMSGKKCKECKGTKKGKYDDICYYCEGTGEEFVYNWEKAYAVSASFSIFFALAAYPEMKTSSKLLQLMTVRTLTEKGMHGGSLSGYFSIPICNWLRQLDKHSNVPEIISAMKTAYRFMFNAKIKDWIFEHDFRAYVNEGFLIVDCPGNACGLNPTSFNSFYGEKNNGYEFSCHNVDTPAQQLTLLAGLAALHDKVRLETNRSK
jgi:hypothetical protein